MPASRKSGAGGPVLGAPRALGRHPAIMVLALLGVFAAEMALFWAGTRRHVAWFYPRWSDQLQYLREAYGCYDRMQSVGFLQGARQALAADSAQGSLQGLLGMMAFALGGPARTPALAVNLVAFLCLQAATFAAVRRYSGSRAFAWAAVGLLAAMHSPWSDAAGSATDYRLDWMAACAYGVALAAAILGDGFRSFRWAVLFGCAVGFALLARHLTAVYFGLVYVFLAGWVLVLPGRWGRGGRLATSGICALAVSGWAFWRSWRGIYAYYWIDRFVGPESALRDSHMRPAQYFGWLGFELLVHQLGIAALLLALGGAVAFWIAGRAAGDRGIGPAVARAPGQSAWPVVLAFLAAPAAVLLLHPEKTPQPLNIMIPGAAWAILLAWLTVSRRASLAATAATCAAIGLAGVLLFAWAQFRSPYTPEMEAAYRQMNGLSDFLYFRAEESGLSRPSVAVNRILDGMNAASFEVLGRERHRTPLPFIARLPSGLLEDAPADVISRLAGSDFVCLVTRGPANWPFDREMASMQPQLRAWCDGNLRHDGDIETAQFAASIYERRSLARPPAAGGVDLASMVAAASRGRPDAPVAPPGPPWMTSPATVSWTTRAEFRYVVRAAYSPVTFRAESLPDGMRLNAATGEISGMFRGSGSFHARIGAYNALGSAGADVTMLVGDKPWDASVSAPAAASLHAAAEIGFVAFDSRGTLDFVDVTDLTAMKVIARIEANDDERRIWEGTCRVGFREAGAHTVKLRFVRYDPSGDGTYTFLDRDCVIAVGQ